MVEKDGKAQAPGRRLRSAQHRCLSTPPRLKPLEKPPWMQLWPRRTCGGHLPMLYLLRPSIRMSLSQKETLFLRGGSGAGGFWGLR